MTDMLSLTRKPQFILESVARLPSKYFNFNMILSYALMQFIKVFSCFYALQELHYSMDKGLLQKTSQTTVPQTSAFFGLNDHGELFVMSSFLLN